VVVSGAVVAAAMTAGTFAFDFLAYHGAAARVLAGERLYDPSVQVTGGFGLFYYPPPLVLAILPFALLSASAASWAWLAMSVAMLVGAIWLMPVRSTVRWATLLLAGLSWPVAYALKLGQVGPLLLFLFAIGWRWLDRPVAVGVSGAVGAIVKLQPGLILVWALVTRRWAAVVVGAAVLLGSAIIATLVAGGPSIWPDFITLIRNLSDPVTTPHNFTPGAIAFQAGAPVALAAVLQLGSTIAVVALVAFAALRLPADASYLATVVASQLLSPVLWDHYALLLLLPTAWLLDRGCWWAVAIPLLSSVILLPAGLPGAIYPFAFWAALLAVVAVGARDGRRSVLTPGEGVPGSAPAVRP
jgi:alpha-1,2-mannosyltransferase